jgi:hypothetical protein
MEEWSNGILRVKAETNHLNFQKLLQAHYSLIPIRTKRLSPHSWFVYHRTNKNQRMNNIYFYCIKSIDILLDFNGFNTRRFVAGICVAVCGISIYSIFEYWNVKGSNFLINCVGGSI